MTSKLLFYTHGLVDGGAERLWACLATAMKKRGYDVVFVQDFEADDNRANLDPSIPLYTLGKGHISATRRLAEVLKQEKADVAIAAVGGSNTKLMIARWLAKVPLKTIITYHGFREWRTGLLSFVTYFGLPILSAMADATVAVSDGLRERLVATWGAKPEKTVTILNPVFFPQSAKVPGEAELAARPDTILAAGRFVPEKDFITLVKAFARMNRPQARLVIIGKGPGEAKLVEEIERLGIADRVTLPGYVRQPWNYYEQAKCFALSSMSEPFGTVVVEALAHGLPVVSTACSGPQEILCHGEFGRIVAVGNELQLAAALSATLDNPGDPAQRRKRADDFSFEVRVPAYESLIKKVLGDAAAPQAEMPDTATLAATATAAKSAA
jgi:glycosyltransferase involved in cell wall biosynthesis